MEVDKGPLSLSQRDKLDYLLNMAANRVSLFVFKLNVAVPEEQVVMDSFLVFADRLDDVQSLERAVGLNKRADTVVLLRVDQMLVPKHVESWLQFVLTVSCSPWDCCRRV